MIMAKKNHEKPPDIFFAMVSSIFFKNKCTELKVRKWFFNVDVKEPWRETPPLLD